ncbi:GD19710 [Drosophila simulans]|uniref:GD19710 n=1 Tax=Drosophila simulans TaxID=7240 RepID=B4QUZ0_DROSI|nr:GD19710 [Drosophila simulans]
MTASGSRWTGVSGLTIKRHNKDSAGGTTLIGHVLPATTSKSRHLMRDGRGSKVNGEEEQKSRRAEDDAN